MNKPLIQYISDVVNNCRNIDEEVIREVVSADSRITPAIKEHKSKNKDGHSNEVEKNTIVTAEDIREEMMRPMVEDSTLTQEDINIADEEEYTR